MRARKSEWLYLFLEYMLMAIADGLVALTGWIGVKLYKRWKRRQRRRDKD
jgi:hypothetical protein